MEFCADALAESLRRLSALQHDQHYAVAFSGGADSTALLLALVELVGADRVTALHFNHNLHPDSGGWLRQCEVLCARIGVRFEADRWHRSDTTPSQEANARRARYSWFGRVVRQSQLLLTAHHFDDQAESVLMNLVEARSLERIAGIPSKRSLDFGDDRVVVRPLLGFNRQSLEFWLHNRGYSWIDDPANSDDRFSRNFIRHQVLPLLQSRWPATAKSLNQFSSRLTEALGIVDQAANALIQRVAVDQYKTPLCLVAPLETEKLVSHTSFMFGSVLRSWLHAAGISAPSGKQLDELLRQLRDDGDGSQCSIRVSDAEIACFDNRLHLIRRQQIADDLDRICEVDSVTLWPGLAVSFIPAATGIHRATVERGAFHWRMRSGGEKVKLPGKSHRTSLKKLMQLRRIPPWQRDRLPILYDDDRVVWVAGLGLMDGYHDSGEPGTALQPGIELT